MKNLSYIDIFIKSDKVANICQNPKYRSHKNEAWNFNIDKMIRFALKIITKFKNYFFLDN